MNDIQKKYKMSHQVIRMTGPLDLGEGPHWDCAAQALYFVNMYRGEIHKYKPDTNQHSAIVIGDGKKHVTFVFPVENQCNTFVIGYGGELATVEWDEVNNTTKNLKTLHVLEENYPTVRLNDGKVSPSGIIFVGSMGELLPDGTFPNNLGNLFAYNPATCTSKKLLCNIGVGNGLTWSLDERIFYFVDSLSGQIRAYDYDRKNISISNERVIYDFHDIHLDPPKIIPDGMTIDTSGNIWIAVNNSGEVYQINPKTKSIHSVIPIHIKSITSVTFGGPNLEDLYVTSMSRKLGEEEKKEQPNSGCLFKITGIGTKGIGGVGVTITEPKK